jgi:aspartate aminotransferase-like enzyme
VTEPIVPSEDAPLLLMTPGPTRVPERVLRAGARPMIHHRTPGFSSELQSMVELLGPVFGTTTPVLPVHTTGRGAMEAAICNLFSAGDEVAACCNGSFGEMWAKVAESYGLVVHRVATDWSRSVDPDALAALVRERPAIRAALVALCDTSTGVHNDIAAVCRAGRERGVLVLVDGVSAIGGMPFAFDAWGVDVAVTASQKCLMASPGLAFVAMSERAWAATTTARLPRNYWDFGAIKRTLAGARPETPGTAPVHLVLQVSEALRMMHEEGLDAVFARHQANAERVRKRLPALRLAPQCPALESLAPTVTAIALPNGYTPRMVRDGLTSRGILTAAGIGPFEPTAFRIGHMGDIRLADVDRTLSALSETLAELALCGVPSLARAPIREPVSQ